MSKFAMYAKFKAQPGQRDALARILLEAAEQCESEQGCELYIVNASDEDPDIIWVTELWSDAEAHAESLRNEDTVALIGRARPLIAGVEPIKLRPLGGKGFQ
ncbi:putative quinol monooxygenase [Paenibacillus piri]|uniref:Antibiotic biosynthesis monooxygenase n=1 Tax=Paenibacillus piri TaxID=2547395 RepID=A0A4R5KQI2_9BACL|nr:antibiotic biosynthesis monooxygenase [Paenibacillus piri]TDF98003.1 antibiotic biosynthesis monooxygenase [Paenibacillus piri]